MSSLVPAINWYAAYIDDSNKKAIKIFRKRIVGWFYECTPLKMRGIVPKTVESPISFAEDLPMFKAYVHEKDWMAFRSKTLSDYNDKLTKGDKYAT